MRRDVIVRRSILLALLAALPAAAATVRFIADYPPVILSEGWVGVRERKDLGDQKWDLCVVRLR